MTDDRGRTGLTGATGDTGRAGAAGARGETGETGQAGRVGEQGAPGISGDQEEHRRTVAGFRYVNRMRAIVFFIAMFTIFAVGWGTDYQSCKRQIPIRAESNHRTAVLNDFLNTAAYAREQSALRERGPQRRIDLNAASHWRSDAKQLHNVSVPKCLAVLPPV